METEKLEMTHEELHVLICAIRGRFNQDKNDPATFERAFGKLLKARHNLEQATTVRFFESRVKQA